MKKIGIMGGTFNPIHNAHLILGQTALTEFHLDEILFLPSGRPAYKDLKEIASDKDRMNMVISAVYKNNKFIVSDMEIKREGNTYTADTLLELTENNPENKYYYIIGGDSLLTLKKWSRPDIVLSKAVILAASRANLKEEQIQNEIVYLKQTFNSADIQYLKVPNMDISSHMLRQMCNENKSIQYYVPDSVYDYIKEYRLYEQ